MSSSNYFGPREFPSEGANDGYDSYSDQMDYPFDERSDGQDFLTQKMDEKMADDFAAAIKITEAASEDETDSNADSLKTYLNQWKQQQSTDRDLCENAENSAREILGSEYRSILSQGLGKPEAILQSWFDRPACMPPQIPLVIEFLKFCPPEYWPMRWQQATSKNSEQQ